MDAYTREHLAKWIELHVCSCADCGRGGHDDDCSADKVHESIKRFAVEHPELIGVRSWPEIRSLVERARD